MRERPVTNQQELDKAANDLRALGDHLPLVITVTEGKRIRTEGQNKRYWSEVQWFREQLSQAIEQVAEHTGYTPLEVKRLIAQELEPEQIAILFARSSETVHDCLKEICGIPTSTRLGTKEFMKYEERLTQVMMEIIGTVQAITTRALS